MQSCELSPLLRALDAQLAGEGGDAEVTPADLLRRIAQARHRLGIRMPRGHPHHAPPLASPHPAAHPAARRYACRPSVKLPPVRTQGPPGRRWLPSPHSRAGPWP
jgi:hypothetical protein